MLPGRNYTKLRPPKFTINNLLYLTSVRFVGTKFSYRTNNSDPFSFEFFVYSQTSVVRIWELVLFTFSFWAQFKLLPLFVV